MIFTRLLFLKSGLSSLYSSREPIYIGSLEAYLAAQSEIRQLARVTPANKGPITDFQLQAHVAAVQYLLAIEAGHDL